MSSGLLVALEAVLVLGGVLGLAVWELLRLRKERARDAANVGADASSKPDQPVDYQ